ncbi:MAG: NUDIX domain-containing protein [Actinobacteria bacterium]|nr:NUDIX domain-containing protein [Actinomycetota bacterium]
MSFAADDDLPVAGTVVVLRDGAEGIEALLLRRPARGSFAGAWVFPGGMVDPGDRIPGAEECDDARRAAVREAAEEVGLALGALSPLSCWVPPVGIPKRVRTWFFLAADPGQEITVSPAEVAETRWLTPDRALEAHGAGGLTLFPPTWRTLHELRGEESVAAVLAAPQTPVVHRTRNVHTEDGTIFHWDGDELAGRPPGSRERIVAEQLPWRFELS